MSEFVAPNSQRAIDYAAKKGFEVVFPKTNELQIDIDDDAAMEVYRAHYDIVDHYWGIKEDRVTQSKSGEPGKRHITVTLNQNVTDKERIALQAMLGSDRKRELLSYVQAEEGDAHPTLFLEKKIFNFEDDRTTGEMIDETGPVDVEIG